MKGDKCELCGRTILTDSSCNCIERSPNEIIKMIGVIEGDIIDSPVFGKLTVKGVGFRMPECNEVVKDPFLQLAVFWVEHPDGFGGWIDLYLDKRKPDQHVPVTGWNKFREKIEEMYPGADKKKIIEFVEKIASNEFRKNSSRDEYGKQIFFQLF